MARPAPSAPNASTGRMVAWVSSADRSGWKPYVAVSAATLGALVIALALAPLSQTIPAPLFLVPVALSGAFGRMGPALLASVLGAMALDYFFETPQRSFEITELSTVVNLGTFLFVAVLLGFVHARLRRARDESEAARWRAERASRAREELLAAVSHELRTPLTAIKSAVSALRDQAHALPDATRSRLLANVESDADRLVRMVADILDLNRLEAGVESRRERNAVGDVVSAAVDRCAPALGDRPIDFRVPDTLPFARFDAHLLDRALTSLVENAAVHTPPGTPVAVEAWVEGDELRLTVTDAGPGVPADARERIFAKYARIDPNGPGLGLGLALARAAVEAQGGRLWVEDGPDGGARFVVAIPGAVDPRDTA